MQTRIDVNIRREHLTQNDCSEQMLELGYHSLLEWRLYCQDMHDLNEIYKCCQNATEVYNRVRSDGDRGDLYFLWKWQSKSFDCQYK